MKKDTLLQRVAKIKDLAEYSFEIGIQGTDVVPGDSTGRGLVAIARKNEFGIGVPARPWMQTTVDRFASTVWADDMRKIATLAVRGENDKIEQGYRIIGVSMVSNMQDTLREGPWTPNSPVTIKLKGSAQPLIDTGQLIQSHRAVLLYKGTRTLIA